MSQEKYKNRARNFVNSNSKFCIRYKNLKYEEINRICRKELRNYEKKSRSNEKEYLELKGNSEEFFENYCDIKKKKFNKHEEKLKDDIIMSPFFNLINTYILKGYKVPDLTSTKKNIFKRSLLIEEPTKLKEYFTVNKLSNKEVKELNYLRKFKKRVYYLQNLNYIKKKNLTKKKEEDDIDDNKNYNSNDYCNNKIICKTESNNKILEKNYSNLSNEEIKLKEYNNLMKQLIDSSEKDYTKIKLNLNKSSLLFPSSTKGRIPITLKREVISPQKIKDNYIAKRQSNSIFFYKKNLFKKKKIKDLKSSFINYKNFKNKRKFSEINSFNSFTGSLNNSIYKKTLPNNLVATNNGLTSFFKIIDKTKNNITDYDFNNIKKIIYNRYSYDSKGKKIEEKIKILDKQIMHLDKDLIKGYQKGQISD